MCSVRVLALAFACRKKYTENVSRSLCTYTLLFIHTHSHTHIDTYTHTHTHKHVCAHKHIHIHAYTHKFMYVHINTFTCMRAETQNFLSHKCPMRRTHFKKKNVNEVNPAAGKATKHKIRKRKKRKRKKSTPTPLYTSPETRLGNTQPTRSKASYPGLCLAEYTQAYISRLLVLSPLLEPPCPLPSLFPLPTPPVPCTPCPSPC